jgi:hypothetical protein
MSNLKHIKFGKPVIPINELAFNPNNKHYTFYQICQFKHPFTGKYDTRKIIFDSTGDIKKVYERQYKSTEVEKFLKSNSQNKYSMYPVKEISTIGYPNIAEMMAVCSDLINNSCQNYEHQKW